MKRNSILLLIVVALAAACADTSAPPPAVAPSGDERYIVDPRLGYDAAVPPAVDARFTAAWRYALSGDRLNARKRLDEILAKNPTYAPARLANAAMLIREHQVAPAREIVDALLAESPHYTAAEIYRAEMAVQEGNARRGYDLYRGIVSEPAAPEVARERLAELQKTLFERSYSAAQTASDTDAIPLLRQALELNPGASDARILLAQKLVAARQYDEARSTLDPVLSTADADRPEVQQSLAEIDIGRARYQEAIVRYERLAHRDARFTPRLEQIKDEFAAANMPPQYQRAVETELITRADLAVLMYWKIASIRFASNLGTPPIAVDVSETPGREELIRAITLGIFSVDPVTRRVGPATPVTATNLARTAARVLAVRGAACARSAGNDAQKVLAACGVADPTINGPESPVTGRGAAVVLEQVDRALK